MIFSVMSALSLAVILGFSFVSFVLRKSETSHTAILLHAMLMASAAILLWAYMMNNVPGLAETTVLFLVACGSVGLLYAREFAARQVPRWLVVTHGFFSIIGLGLLLIVEISRHAHM